MDFLLGARGGLDERRRGAGGRLGQTGAQRALQLRDVITVLKEWRKQRTVHAMKTYSCRLFLLVVFSSLVSVFSLHFLLLASLASFFEVIQQLQPLHCIFILFFNKMQFLYIWPLFHIDQQKGCEIYKLNSKKFKKSKLVEVKIS